MTTFIETLRQDENGDGVLETIHVNTYDRTYDAAGRTATELQTFDLRGDGKDITTSKLTFTYDESGRLATKTSESPDFDGDGASDYAHVTTNTYGPYGVTNIHVSNYMWGELLDQDYRDEVFTYNKKGLLAEHIIDDPSFFDYIVGDQYKYNGKGQLTEVKHQDPFDYGDDAWHTEQKFSYDKYGRIAKVTDFGEYTEAGYADKVVTTIRYWGSYNGYQDERVTAHLDGKGLSTTRTEKWFNASGQETDQLVWNDPDGDGDWDSRDRVRKAYADLDGNGTAELVSHTIDEGMNGTVDYAWTFDTLVA
jgi:hypothetical protein